MTDPACSNRIENNAVEFNVPNQQVFNTTFAEAVTVRASGVTFTNCTFIKKTSESDS